MGQVTASEPSGFHQHGLCPDEDVFFLWLNVQMWAPLGITRHFLGAQTQPFQPHGHQHPTLVPLKGILTQMLALPSQGDLPLCKSCLF